LTNESTFLSRFKASIASRRRPPEGLALVNALWDSVSDAEINPAQAAELKRRLESLSFRKESRLAPSRISPRVATCGN
jgi:putative addiction module component (TIGR02574 family)